MKRLYITFYAIFFVLMCFTSVSAQTPSIQATYSCVNNNATLSVANVSNVTSYTWRNASTLVLEGTTATLTKASGSYTVTIIQTSGSTTLGPYTLNSPIIPTTPPTIIPPTDVTTPLCGSVSRTITASGATTYSWKQNNVSLGVAGNSLNVVGTSVATEGTYNFTVTAVNAITTCESVSSAVVSLKLSPTIPSTPTISGIATFCTGGSTTLTSSDTGTGGTYLWSNNATTKSITTSTAGAYTVKVANTVGCQSASSTAINVTQSAVLATPTITGTTTFCAGDSTILTSSTAGLGGTYLWNNGKTTQSIIVKTAGIFNVKITNSSGCASTISTNTTTTVNAIPATPIIAGIATICSGDSTTLKSSSAGTGGSYLWSNSKTSDSIVVKTAGNYTVKTISSMGCYSASSIAFILKANPLPSKPTITGLKAICLGDSAILSSSSAGTGTYLWNNGKTTSTILTKTAGKYTVRTISALGCKSPVSDTLTLMINPLPAPPTLTNNFSTFCAVNNASTFQSSYTTGYNVWYRSNQTKDLTTALAVKTLTVSDSNTYKVSNITVKVRAQDTLGCISPYSNAIILTINPSPQKPTIQTSTNSLSFCDKDSLLLTAISKNIVTSYIWNNTKTSTSIYTKTGGSYAVTVTNSYGCSSASDNVLLTVNPLPAKPTIAALTGKFLEFCSGDSTILVASSSGASIFNWSTGQAALSVTYKTTQSAISAIALSNKGCKSLESSNVLAIKMFPRPSSPSITTNGPTEFCPDKSITLSSVISPKSYVWYLNKTLVKDSVQQKITVNKAGIYGLQTTSPGPFSGSCYSIDTAFVTVKALDAPLTPSIFTRSPTIFCDGGQVILEALAANVNVVKYSWRDETSKQEYATSANITITKSGKYSLKVIDSRTCFSAYSDPISITVNTLPQKPSIIASTSKMFCIGDSTILQSSLPTSTPASNANKYFWKIDNIASTITGRTISLKTSSIVSVSITDANGCVGVAASDTVKTTVNPLPATPYITLFGSNPFCADKSILLNGSEDVGYKWSTGAKTRNIQVNLAGSYSLQTINKYNCLSKPSTPVVAFVNPLPPITTITAQGNTTFCNGDSVKLTTQNNLTSYWYLNTNDSLGRSKLGNLFKAVKGGKYSVRVQDSNGCLSAQSNAITIDVRALPTTTSDNTITSFGPFSLEAPILGDDNGYEWKINDKIQANYITKVVKAIQGGQYQVRGSVTYSSIPNIATNKLLCYSPWSLVKNYVEDPSYEGLSIYPNPSSSGDFWIQTSEDLHGAEISIHDIIGRLLYTETINEFTTAKKVSVTAYSGSSFIIKVKNAVYSKAKLVFVIN